MEAPLDLTYITVVSWDLVQILSMIYAILYIPIKSADVHNALLKAQNMEKCYIIAGPEFEHEQENIFVVNRSLYRLKYSSASFRYFVAKNLDKMGFKSYYAE